MKTVATLATQKLCMLCIYSVNQQGEFNIKCCDSAHTANEKRCSFISKTTTTMHGHGLHVI